MRYLIVNDNNFGHGSALVEGLRDAGHWATLLDYSTHGFWRYLRDKFLPRFRISFVRSKSLKEFENKILKTIKEQKIDSVICFCGTIIFSDYSLKELQKNSPEVERVIWLYDAVENRPEVGFLLAYFDRIYTFIEHDVPAIKKLTDSPVQLLYLFSNDQYKPVANVRKTIDICFVGAWYDALYKTRRKILRRVSQLSLAHGWKFVVVGPGGFRSPLKFIRDLSAAKGFTGNIRSGPLGHAEINDLYQKSKIVINFSPDAHWSGFPMRIFEVTGSGTCLVTEYLDGLERLFGPGEVVTFNYETLESALVDIISDDKKRERIALSGMRKTMSHHVISKRVDVLTAQK